MVKGKTFPEEREAMADMIKLTVVDKLPESIGIGSTLQVIEMDDREIVLSLVSLNKQDGNSKMIQRQNAIMKLRKTVGAPLDMGDYKPLTKDEIHED